MIIWCLKIVEVKWIPDPKHFRAHWAQSILDTLKIKSIDTGPRVFVNSALGCEQ